MFPWAMIVVLVVLAVRVFWTAAGTETGFPFLSQQWQRATVGWVVDTEPISAKTPREQADFWLAESQRVLDENANASPHRRALLAMGAAQTLTMPCGNHIDSVEFNTKISVPLEPGDRGTFPAAYDTREEQQAFAAATRDRVNELARLATEWDPAEPDWWRLRVLLWYATTDYNALPTAAWYDLLTEAASHDPDNAIYDYLTAGTRLEAATEFESPADATSPIRIVDRDEWDAGWLALDRGLQKPGFYSARQDWESMLEFVAVANVSPLVLDELVISRELEPHIFQWHRWIDNILSDRAEVVESAGDFAGALQLLRESEQLVEQYEVDRRNPYQHLAEAIRSVRIADQLRLNARHGGLLTATEVTAARATMTRAYFNYELAVIVELEGRDPNYPSPLFPRTRHVEVYALDLAAAWSALLAAFALPAFVMARCLRRKGNPTPPPRAVWQMTLCFLTGLVCLALSGIFLGVMPAGWISREAQHWIFTALVLGLPGLGIIALVLWRLKRNRFRFTLDSLILGMIFTSFLMVFLFQVLFAPGMAPFPLPLDTSPHDAFGLDGRSLDTALKPRNSMPHLALLQWMAYGGPTVTFVAWLVTSACVLAGTLRRRTVAARDEVARPQGWTSRLRDFLALLTWHWSRGGTLVAALLLACYLACTPAILSQQEAQFHAVVDPVRDQAAYWSRLDAYRASLEQDAARMTSLQTSTATRVQQLLQPTQAGGSNRSPGAARED